MPTGIDFAPDGSLFMADWVTGWNDKGYGRIWKMTDETAKGWGLQKQTEAEIKADYKKLSEADLKSKLYFEDLRIRRKAQFELVKRGKILRSVPRQLNGWEIFATRKRAKN